MERTQTLSILTPQSFVQNIHEKHHADLLLFTRGKMQNAKEGEEILQNFYLKLMKKHPVIFPKYKELGLRYLCGIISNLCNDRFKAQKKKRNKVSLDEHPMEIKIDGGDYCPTVIYERNHDELRPMLTELEYQLLVMRIQGFSHQDIAERLGISVSNASVMLYRIRKKIGQHFER